MRAPAERAAVAPLGTVSAEPPETAAAVNISSGQRRSRRGRGSTGKRPSSRACSGPRQRQRVRSGEDAAAGATAKAEAATAAILAAVGTDQQAAAPAERDSGCHNGSRNSKHSVGTRANGTAINGVPHTGVGADVHTATRAVMAGTGEVLAADMADSTALLQRQDWKGLRRRLQRDGYLLLRGVLPASTVLKVIHLLSSCTCRGLLHLQFQPCGLQFLAL